MIDIFKVICALKRNDEGLLFWDVSMFFNYLKVGKSHVIFTSSLFLLLHIIYASSSNYKANSKNKRKDVFFRCSFSIFDIPWPEWNFSWTKLTQLHYVEAWNGNIYSSTSEEDGPFSWDMFVILVSDNFLSFLIAQKQTKLDSQKNRLYECITSVNTHPFI